MENNQSASQEKDPALWAIAKKRAGFKRDLAIYFTVNAFLWLIWMLSGHSSTNSGIPWPVWPTAGWGIAILFQYIDAYSYPKENMAEKEYEKLRK